ncbi:MAG: hypothetical protein ABIP03_06060 [Aquihabitans sp.]
MIAVVVTSNSPLILLVAFTVFVVLATALNVWWATADRRDRRRAHDRSMSALAKAAGR